MTQEEFYQINNLYLTKISRVKEKFVRYLYNEINWNVRLIGIKGERGVGKSTMLLQRIKMAHKKNDNVFYASLDNLWFQTHTLTELAEWLYQRGVRYLFLDEVHKYPDWALAIKNLYDTYDDLNIVYTGSCMLEIDHSKVDLSRRQTLYTLHGLSFREYLELNGIISSRPWALSDLLAEHSALAMDISQQIPILKHFADYLERGYYPFHIDAGRDYLLRLGEIVELVIESDLPSAERLSYQTLQKAKLLISVVAQNVPLVPNIAKLSSQLETTRDLCLKLLYALDKAGILMLLTKQAKNYKHLTGPEKIYLGNTNLMHAIGCKVNEGTQRETFFFNQFSMFSSLYATPEGDFRSESGILFEIGGKGKDFSQIAEIPNSYLVVDDIEIGSRNRIPLWLFGWLY